MLTINADAQLQEGGVRTTLDLVQLVPATVRRRWSVVLERTLAERQWVQCMDLDDAPTPKRPASNAARFARMKATGPNL